MVIRKLLRILVVVVVLVVVDDCVNYIQQHRAGRLPLKYHTRIQSTERKRCAIQVRVGNMRNQVI